MHIITMNGQIYWTSQQKNIAEGFVDMIETVGGGVFDWLRDLDQAKAYEVKEGVAWSTVEGWDSLADWEEDIEPHIDTIPTTLDREDIEAACSRRGLDITASIYS
jgi:hypothetical protein